MKVSDSGVPRQAYGEWGLRSASLMEESAALWTEATSLWGEAASNMDKLSKMAPMDRAAAFAVWQDAYRQAMQEMRIRADSILGRWRALATPQDPRVIEISRMTESVLMEGVAAFQEAYAFSDDLDVEHMNKARGLINSANEKLKEVTELSVRLVESLDQRGG